MGKKLKIVIAEDGTELGKSCEKALKSYGMDVIMCDKSGTQLLEKIGEARCSACRYFYAESRYFGRA